MPKKIRNEPAKENLKSWYEVEAKRSQDRRSLNLSYTDEWYHAKHSEKLKNIENRKKKIEREERKLEREKIEMRYS